MVGHVDDQLQGRASELHVPLDELHHLARDECAGRRVLRRGAVEFEGLRLDVGPERTATKYHADDEAYWKNVYYWNTPVANCGDDRGEVCKDVRATGEPAWTEIRARLNGPAMAAVRARAAAPEAPGAAAARLSLIATRGSGSARCSPRRSGGWASPTSARCSCCSSPRSGASTRLADQCRPRVDARQLPDARRGAGLPGDHAPDGGHGSRGDRHRRRARVPDRVLHGTHRDAARAGPRSSSRS